MIQWYVKDLSKLTGVSVQTLHHYDRIDLLKPSLRLANGYRMYSEQDLLKLQQIIALKFFDFSLAQIKTLLTDEAGAREHFAIQAKLLEHKAHTLIDASKALKSITSDVIDDKSIPWETIIKIIEVYHMTQKLDHAWVKDIFTPDELKQYVDFRTTLESSSSLEQKTSFEKKWMDLVDAFKANLHHDPTSAIGISLAEQCMALINALYGKKYAHLRTKIFEQGFGQGKGLEEVGLTPEIVAWLEKATDAYWRKRIYDMLKRVGKEPAMVLRNAWHDLLDEMYGDAAKRKALLYDIALSDENISAEAKQWLRQLAH